MANEWIQTHVADLGRVVTGRTPPGNDPAYYDGDVQFLTPSDMVGYRRVERTARSLSSYGAKQLVRCLVPHGVAVSCIGWQMGKAILIDRPTITNQQINSVIINENVADPSFVYYSLLARRGELFNLGAGGSRTPILNKGNFERLPFLLPPLPVQRAIAHILGTLDDKIELIRRINATLEAMAQTLFKRWFVDLDEVPEGWEVRGLDEIADYLNGLALQKFPANGDVFLPVIKIAQLRAGTTQSADHASTDIRAEYIVEDGDVLFSWSGSLEVELWCGGQGALNQHLFKISSRDYPKWFYYLWTRHHLADFQGIAANKATTMGHIQRHHLSEAKVLVPPKQVLDEMNHRIEPLIEKIIANRIQSRTLAALRDALLPKLLSGAIHLKDSDRLDNMS